MKILAFFTLVLLALTSKPVKAESPIHLELLKAGWFDQYYNTGIDPNAIYKETPSSFIELRDEGAVAESYAFLYEATRITQYQGKRIRFSAAVKTHNVESWSGLFMGIYDDPGSLKNNRKRRTERMWVNTLAFDNMYERAIVGTTDWARYSVVLDIPEGAYMMRFGGHLSGAGKVWFNDFQIELVTDAVPVTVITETSKN